MDKYLPEKQMMEDLTKQGGVEAMRAELFINIMPLFRQLIQESPGAQDAPGTYCEEFCFVAGMAVGEALIPGPEFDGDAVDFYTKLFERVQSDFMHGFMKAVDARLQVKGPQN